ncbi:MAG: hypothetical protein PHD43_14295 [Methylococcales bacterium]|nr:hypothetical protein [Methylococcales bacterium]
MKNNNLPPQGLLKSLFAFLVGTLFNYKMVKVFFNLAAYGFFRDFIVNRSYFLFIVCFLCVLAFVLRRFTSKYDANGMTRFLPAMANNIKTDCDSSKETPFF